jgi:hypothetical protein
MDMDEKTALVFEIEWSRSFDALGREGEVVREVELPDRRLVAADDFEETLARR